MSLVFLLRNTRLNSMLPTVILLFFCQVLKKLGFYSRTSSEFLVSCRPTLLEASKIFIFKALVLVTWRLCKMLLNESTFIIRITG